MKYIIKVLLKFQNFLSNFKHFTRDELKKEQIIFKFLFVTQRLSNFFFFFETGKLCTNMPLIHTEKLMFFFSNITLRVMTK